MATTPYNLQPLRMPDASKGMQTILNAVEQRKDKIKETNRIHNAKIQSELSKLEIGKLVSERNREEANLQLNMIEEALTDAMMYQSDGKRKESGIYGPVISDSEFQNIMGRVQEADNLMTRLITEEKAVTGQENIYKKELYKPTGNIDTQRTKRNLDLYYQEGVMPEDGNFIVLNPLPSDVWMSDSGYYRKEDSVYGGYRDADDKYKTSVYRVEMNDPRKQLGITHEMVNEMNSQTELGKAAYDKLIAQGLDNEAIFSMVNGLNNTGKPHPLLVNTAIEWGEVDAKKYRDIAKGYTARKPEKEKEDQFIKSPQPRTISFMGKDFDNYIDVTNTPATSTTGRLLKGYRLPSGSEKYVVNVGKFGDKPQKIKNVKEKEHDFDYVVSGWDEDAGVIRLKRLYTTKQEKERQTKKIKQEYFIPIQGNERIIDKIKLKIFGKGYKYTKPETSKFIGVPKGGF